MIPLLFPCLKVPQKSLVTTNSKNLWLRLGCCSTVCLESNDTAGSDAMELHESHVADSQHWLSMKV